MPSSLVMCIFLISEVSALWPPEYAIQLEVTDTFIISDMFDNDDAEDFGDDDVNMIRSADLRRLIRPEDEKKYFMLRELAERKNREALEKSATSAPADLVGNQIAEYFYDFDDEPAYGEFLDESENVDDETRINRNEPNQPVRKIKRSDDYDYAKFKHEYDQNAAELAKSKDVLKYVDVTEKEGLKDSAKNILKFKAVKNCTAAETKGIGFDAIRCFFKDLPNVSKKPEAERRSLLARLLKVVLIWLAVYVTIAVPCWCTRGWCCCCCRCKFCKPRRTIDAAKEFLANNPVGVLRVDGKEFTYPPTVYEQYAQQRLEKVLMKL